MDAIQLLKADHKKVKELLAELAKTTARATRTRSELLAQIRVNLEAHTTIEEEIFYPAFKKAGTKDDAKVYFEALEEHRAAGDLVLPDLLDTDVGSERFSGRAKVLRELVEGRRGGDVQGGEEAAVGSGAQGTGRAHGTAQGRTGRATRWSGRKGLSRGCNHENRTTRTETPNRRRRPTMRF